MDLLAVLGPNYSIPSSLPKRNGPYKSLLTNVQRSLIHDSPKWEITQMSINRCMAKYMVYSYSAIKRRELLIQITAWMNLKHMLNERSQTQKNTYSMTVFI